MLTFNQVRQSVHSACGPFCLPKQINKGENHMATEAQINANRKNAESSTGPSETGKARSSMNAIKTGLTGRIMLLTPEDAPIYQTHMDRYYAKYAPANPDEHDLVQIIADTEWRLAHIAPLERGLYVTGRDKCAHLVEHIQDPNQRAAALHTEIYLFFQKQLLNLSLQETRLTRKLEKALLKLETLQKQRKENQLKDLAHARRSIENGKANNIIPDFAECGFTFTIEEFELFQIRSRDFSIISGGKTLDFDLFLTLHRAAIATQNSKAA